MLMARSDSASVPLRGDAIILNWRYLTIGGQSSSRMIGRKDRFTKWCNFKLDDGNDNDGNDSMKVRVLLCLDQHGVRAKRRSSSGHSATNHRNQK